MDSKWNWHYCGFLTLALHAGCSFVHFPGYYNIQVGSDITNWLNQTMYILENDDVHQRGLD